MMRAFRFLALGLAIACPATAAGEEARLTVLHTTDLHGTLTPFDYLADAPAQRGLVKLASLIESMRADSAYTLLLDAGDAIQGGAIETFHRRNRGTAPEPMMTAMSRLRYDAMAVGNHEFSFGLADLEKSRAAASFPWLAANVVRASDGSAAFLPSLIKTLGPLRVGIVGITTPAVPFLEDSANWDGLRFVAPIDPARREVRRLRDSERCDLVVILAHTGLDSPGSRSTDSTARSAAELWEENWGRRLAAEVPGADLVILGHTHAVIPTMEIEGVLVTQAGRFGEGIGRVDLTFTREAAGPWKITGRNARFVRVGERTADDAALREFAEPYHRAARTALDQTVAEATGDLSSPAGRFAEGPVWDLLHRMQLEASGAEVSLAALDAPAVRIPRGPIRLRDVHRLLPYENTLAMVEMSGAELRETLEHGAARLTTYDHSPERPLADPNAPLYLFDSAEGIGYEIDLTQPPGRRIGSLTYQGAPLSPERRLKVVVNSYRRAGAGGFELVRRAPRLWRTSRDVRELLADYLTRTRTITPATTGNWTLLPDYAAAPERRLVDLLVRRQVLSAQEVKRLDPHAHATRADLARWLTAAFGWNERRRSGAFVDVPDSLAATFDALLRRKVVGDLAVGDRMFPFGGIRLPVAQEWLERAARHHRYALAPAPDRAFRNGLLAGIGEAANGSAVAHRPDTLTRIQALAMVANARFPTIRMLETTDFHGAILSTARDRVTGRMVGGSAVLAAHIEKLRAENPEGTVLVDGGDCYQGTMISNLQFGRPVVEQMNALRYTAQAIGNHEFDWTADTLQNRVREMRFAALAANMRERKNGKLPRWVRSDTSFARRGVRVSVLGLSYRYTPSVTLAKHVAHLRFEDDSATVAKLVPGLRARSDAVVVVGHVPAESDSTRRALGGDLPRMARGIAGVDVWFGGHSHNQVIDWIRQKPVMIAGSHGQVIAVSDLVIDPLTHQVVESRAELHPTFVDDVTPDSAMLARVERWNAAVAPIAGQRIGRNQRALFRNRGGESAVGDLVTDAIRAAVQADIAFQNSGGLRADFPAGEVTKATIYEVMPFDNVIFTLELKGRDVERALEDALRFGRVTQVSGIRYTFDLDLPAGDRVVSLTDTRGQPLDPERFYRVACNDFMATGGDNYDALSGGRNRVNTGVLVRQVLEEFVAQRSSAGGLDYQPDGRVQRANPKESGQ